MKNETHQERYLVQSVLNLGGRVLIKTLGVTITKCSPGLLQTTNLQI